MPTKSVVRGKHTFRVKTVIVATGGYTFEIIHIDRSMGAADRSRYLPGIAYESEEVAMENGIAVATEMADDLAEKRRS